MSDHPLVLSRRATVGARIFLACTALYYLTRSPALDEWDSVQFALGVGDFNLWRHQPHPPGYPLYVAFGWLAHHLPLPWGRLDVHDALSLGSALGGGMFVAGWFVLIARRFPSAVAVISTVALAGLVDTWMSATKVLTDPLGTGLLTVALVLLDRGGKRKAEGRRMKDEGAGQMAEGKWAAWQRFAEKMRENAARAQSDSWEVKLFRWPGTYLACGALAAAAAAGVRPQNFGVLLLIMALAIFAWTRQGFIGVRAGWGIGLGVFFAGCLAWVVPVLAIQAHTPESGGRWLTYGEQLVAQWRWRLDQPKAFLGAAGGQDHGMLLYRLDHHLLGWFTRGFGFSLKSFWGWTGLMIVVAGWVMYYLARFGGRLAASGPGAAREQGKASRGTSIGRSDFWRMHLPWAFAYVLMVFCCLPGDQRYYLPIFPLFIVAAVAGWWLWPRGLWRWSALLVPVAALAATLPLVGPNHTEPPPPVRLLRWLQDRYPASEQAKVWLILRDSRRHADWYAPGFHIVRADKLDPSNLFMGVEQARAVYTDDPQVLPLWPYSAAAWHRVAHFQRCPLIYRKHNEVDLYQLAVKSAEPLPH